MQIERLEDRQLFSTVVFTAPVVDGTALIPKSATPPTSVTVELVAGNGVRVTADVTNYDAATPVVVSPTVNQTTRISAFGQTGTAIANTIDALSFGFGHSTVSVLYPNGTPSFVASNPANFAGSGTVAIDVEGFAATSYGIAGGVNFSWRVQVEQDRAYTVKVTYETPDEPATFVAKKGAVKKAERLAARILA
jgi:hypothetical protein